MRILIAEDDAALAGFVRQGLQAEHYTVDVAEDGEQARTMGSEVDYDLVILDLGLPRMDGVNVLRHLRLKRPSLPVLVLTLRSRVEDRVQCLDTGADDYLPKPFSFSELSARIRALLRRSTGHAKSEFNCGPIRLDTRTGRVSVDGNPVKLTSHEYRLLSYLMHHTGRVVSRTELVEHLYDQDFDRDSNTIEVFVGRIRKKLGVDVIQTVRGLGYLLTAAGDAS